MSIEGYAWALHQQTGSPDAKLILLLMGDYMDADRHCMLSLDALADLAEMPPERARKAQLQLGELGLIFPIGAGAYRLLLEPRP
jgi:hypothetical protein